MGCNETKDMRPTFTVNDRSSVGPENRPDWSDADMILNLEIDNEDTTN